MKKLTWGSGVAIGIGIFILGVFVMVGISFSSKTELVTERYYEKGVGYQDRIAVLERTAAREDTLAAVVDTAAIWITFPGGGAVTPLSGTIILYRPSDRTRDLSLPVAPDSAGKQRIPTAGLDRGLWRMKISWREGATEYYNEQPVMLY